jgi:hypothetical protein
MRRALTATVLGGLLLTAATACSGDAETPAAAPTWATPSAEQTSPAPDYSADTKRVCAEVEKIFDKDMESFGTELGKMIAYKEAKATAEAEAAEKAAKKELKDIGAKVRKETAAAQDPELKDAGATSASRFAKSAADAKLFDGIKSTKDLDRVMESQMTVWLTPVAGPCA